MIVLGSISKVHQGGGRHKKSIKRRDTHHEDPEETPRQNLQVQRSNGPSFLAGLPMPSSRIHRNLPLPLRSPLAIIVHQTLNPLSSPLSPPSGKNSIPKIPIVPPLFTKTPIGPIFCLVRVFCTADAKRPTPPVRVVAFNAAETASCAW